MEGFGLSQKMHSPGINGGELRGQPVNPGSPGKMAVNMECVCVTVDQLDWKCYRTRTVQTWPQ